MRPMEISDLTNTHAESRCKGRRCVIHNPTDHHMIDWPINLRETNLIERLCKHGVGHPDPDSVYFFDKIGQKGYDVHGCDGCCRPEQVNTESVDHIFEVGQIWDDVGTRIVIVGVDGNSITYLNGDQDIITEPSYRVLYNGTGSFRLIYPDDPIPSGSVWRGRGGDTGLDVVIFILTDRDEKDNVTFIARGQTDMHTVKASYIMEQFNRVFPSQGWID